MRLRRWGMLLLVSAAACAGGDANRLGPTVPPTLRLDVLSGDQQVGAVHATLPQAIRVRVSDSALGPIPGALVVFVVTQGGGAVFAGSVLTNALGEAAEQWTLGDQAGPQALEARAIDPTTGSPVLVATLTATGQPGPAASLTLTTLDTVLLLGERLVPRQVVAGLADAYGNPIPVSQVQVVAPGAWTTLGDSLWSDVEATGAIQLQAGSAQASLRATAVLDLRPVRWHVAYTCGGLPQVRGNVNIVVDTIAITGPIDSAVYAWDGHPAFSPTLGMRALLFYTATQVRYWADGLVDTTTYVQQQYVATQGVGALSFDGWGSGTATLAQASPRRYQGGSWCQGGWTRSTPVELAE